MKVYKSNITHFTQLLNKIKLSALPKRLFQFGTITTAGLIYYNRENIIKKLDFFYGRYFQYYNEKNTDFQKLVRDNLDIPIENIVIKI